MKLIPFLIAVFLLINPLLEWVFRKLDIQTEKLQFWVMLTSGTAWVIGLVYFLLNPESSLDNFYAEGTDLLPRLAFSQDWISGALVLSTVGLIFITVLTREESPGDNAWLAGLAGACVIGLESNSAYTLALTWTIIEGFHFYYSFRDRQIAFNPRVYLPSALLRLSAPAALILLSMTQNEPGGTGLFPDLDTQSGLVLIAAGLLGFLGWFLSFQGKKDDQSGYFAGAIENWIPGLLGILLILRGSAIIDAGSGLGLIPHILSITLLAIALAGTLLDLTPGLWFLSCGLLISVSAIISGAESALIWCVVMILPGIRIWRGSRQPKKSLIPLVIATLGLLPLPLLPSWAGVFAFSAGIPGILLGLSYGMLLGNVLIAVLKNWGSSESDSEPFPLLGVIGAVAVLASQVIISLRLGLIDTSRDLLSKPITIWISILGLVPVLIMANHLPLQSSEQIRSAMSGLKGRLRKILPTIISILDRAVSFFSRIFEGQAGLIWALLIGLLFITLISGRGG